MPTIYTTILPQILCFSPRDGQNNYVKIYKGSGCSSQVGMNGGEQGISLVGTVGTAGCWHQHPIVHEFIHAFGFYHEHMRPDRDDYVEIIWENIPEGLWYLFDKIAGSETFGVGWGSGSRNTKNTGKYRSSILLNTENVQYRNFNTIEY